MNYILTEFRFGGGYLRRCWARLACGVFASLVARQEILPTAGLFEPDFGTEWGVLTSGTGCASILLHE